MKKITLIPQASPIPEFIQKSNFVEEEDVEYSITFYEALEAMFRAEQKFTRLEWKDKNTYGFVKDSVLKIHRDSKDCDWILSEGDVLGTDWVVIN